MISERFKHLKNHIKLDFMNTQKFILIIDDDKMYRLTLKTLVSKNFDYQVREAEDPYEAFEIIKTEVPILIFLDMQMPKMDGLTALSYIRKSEATKSVPVIACTALVDRRLLVDLAALGISDFIVKPINKESVLQKITKVLEPQTNDDAEIPDIWAKKSSKPHTLE